VFFVRVDACSGVDIDRSLASLFPVLEDGKGLLPIGLPRIRRETREGFARGWGLCLCVASRHALDGVKG